MSMNSLPNRPLLLTEVTSLPDNSEKVRKIRSLTTIELNDLPAAVLSFVMVTQSPGCFGLVFEKQRDAWTTVYESRSEGDDDIHAASDAIYHYWQERTSVTDSTEIETPDGVIDEYTMDLDVDAYLKYF